MFDILVYLFENYDQAEACPEPRQLARKLSAAGFDDNDIRQALDWLSALGTISGPGALSISADSPSFRCYSTVEQSKLGPECRGFLQFLESAGVLDPVMREMILERAMALPSRAVPLSRLKVIVLMVLWNRNRSVDTLILEELLTGTGRALLH